jgi:hypothetical protein
VVWWKRRIEGGLGGILWHSMSCSLEFGLKALFWKCGVHVTLKRGEKYGVVLYLCYFNGKWLKQ